MNTCTWNPSDKSLSLKVKNLHERAQPLKQAYDKPACIDICITHLIKIDNGVAYFGTDIAVETPTNTHLHIHARSSLHKHGWKLANSVGIIDEDYRGEIIIALEPLSTISSTTALKLSYLKDMKIVYPNPNEIIEYLIQDMKFPLSVCQLSLVKSNTPSITYVDTLSDTMRDIQGFGSSSN